MRLDYGALPPEINSGRIYTGPGSGPMIAAAAAWSRLAAELNSAATSYETIVVRLAGEEWLGPASASMAAAATPYSEWMQAAGAQAEQAASQARAAAAAYEAALASHVPPSAVAANRTRLQSLHASNLVGQNTAAIAAAEAHYGEMWAQDATAMYGYAGTSATAAKVAPFSAPAETTTAAGLAGQAAAKAHAAGAAAGSHTQTAELVAALPKALQGLASPTSPPAAPSSPGGGLLSQIMASLGLDNGPLGPWEQLAGPIYNTTGLPYFGVGMANSLQSILKSLMPAAKAVADGANAAAGAAGAAAAPNLAGLLSGLGGGSAVSAGVGQALSAGGLSVPSAWAAAAPAMSPGAAVPVSTVSAVTADAGAGNLLGGMPLAHAGMGPNGGAAPRYGFRPTIMVRSPIAG